MPLVYKMKVSFAFLDWESQARYMSSQSRVRIQLVASFPISSWGAAYASRVANLAGPLPTGDRCQGPMGTSSGVEMLQNSHNPKCSIRPCIVSCWLSLHEATHQCFNQARKPNWWLFCSRMMTMLKCRTWSWSSTSLSPEFGVLPCFIFGGGTLDRLRAFVYTLDAQNHSHAYTHTSLWLGCIISQIT